MPADGVLNEKFVKHGSLKPLNIQPELENDPDDPSLAHALRPIPEKGFRVLRVIYNETVEPVTVVTVFFDDEVII